jgi:hypothetical protein
MRIVEDAHLTEEQKLLWEGAWDYNRQHFEKARVSVEPDESSEFARQLPSWADAPVKEEHWKTHGLSAGSRSRSNSDSSTRTQWPKSKHNTTEPLNQRLEDSDRVYRGGDPRLGRIGPDEYEMVRMRSHSSRTGDRDGFETQMLTRPSRPMPGEEPKHPTSSPTTTKEPALGRSLTNPRRKIRANSTEMRPVQRAGSKFAEQI